MENGGRAELKLPEDPGNQAAIENEANLPAIIRMMELSAEDKARSGIFAEKINPDDNIALLGYGSGAQRKIAGISSRMLSLMNEGSVEDADGSIKEVMAGLRDLGQEKKARSGILSLFKRRSGAKEQGEYAEAERRVDELTRLLQRHRVALLKDIAVLEELFDANHDACRELGMYLYAGQEWVAASRGAGALEGEESLARFEKRLYDLNTSKVIAVQMAAQIRLLQQSDRQVLERLTALISHAIPLWKNQMALTAGMGKSNDVARVGGQTARAVGDAMKHRQKDLVKQKKRIAKLQKEDARALDKLRRDEETLLTALSAVRKAQSEGYAQRDVAQTELRDMDAKLNIKNESEKEAARG